MVVSLTWVVVYFTKHGECYHLHRHCPRLRSAKQVESEKVWGYAGYGHPLVLGGTKRYWCSECDGSKEIARLSMPGRQVAMRRRGF